MLGTLAGIAIVWIATVPLAEIFEHAAIGFPALAIILLGLVAGVRLPLGVPAGLLAIVVGVIMGFVTGESTLTTEGVGVYFPVVVLGDLWAGLQLILADPKILTIVLPIEIYNFIETMNNVESAEAAGDRYNVRTSQFMDGVGTMAGALCGSPFPTTVYIGHPAYKRLGAGCGYALLVGLVFFAGNTFGLIAFLRHIIPVAAVAPILVFVGIVICAQAFNATPHRHAMAVAIAIIPHVSDLLAKKMANLSTCLAKLAPPQLTELGQTLKALSGGQIPAELAERLSAEEIHLMGQQSLSRGAILTGLLWGAMTALLIDGRHLSAAAFALAAMLLSLIGFIHAPDLGLHYTEPTVWGYGLMALLFAATKKGVRTLLKES
jgi:AGZA family xanthine/uracil permease-like MFS transporter